MPLKTPQVWLRVNVTSLIACGLAVVVGVCASGCNYLLPIAYVIGGPPSIEPDFDAMTGKSMTDKDVDVTVVAFAPTNTKWDFPKIDHELSRYVAYQLASHNIKVTKPDQVQAWLDEHDDDWEKPEELGRHFGTKYVIYIDLSRFSLYEENSHTLYRGRSESYLSVYEMDETGYGEKIYSKEVISKFPIRSPRSTSDQDLISFKREYLARLSQEIGWLFFEHYNGDDIQYAT